MLILGECLIFSPLVFKKTAKKTAGILTVAGQGTGYFLVVCL